MPQSDSARPSGAAPGFEAQARVCVFGPFRFDLATGTLLRDGTEVPLTRRHIAILRMVILNAGRTVTKEELFDAVWPGQAVADNNLAQAMSQLRTALDPDDGERYIATVHRRGYRMVMPLEFVAPETAPFDLDKLLAPFRDATHGRAALESFTRGGVASAREIFRDLIARRSDDPSGHIGLANAYAMGSDATRLDAERDVDALRLAITHAHEACRLNPNSAEAFATFGFVMARAGDRETATAALRRAVALEPQNWQHHFRLAYISWGESRLRSANDVLVILPTSAMAHWLIATVFIARDASPQAEQSVDAGLSAQAADMLAPDRLPTVGLHWLKGLLCRARGDEREMSDAFARELALESRDHLYSRECCAQVWYTSARAICDAKTRQRHTRRSSRRSPARRCWRWRAPD